MSASASNAQNPPIAASSTATPANKSLSGSSATVAAGSAPPTARSSYANATKKISSPTIASSGAPAAVGAPQSAQHGKSSSVSPVNGGSITPAVPTMPTIVSGGPNGDHSRKSSVHIKQTPPTTGLSSGIKFGSLAASPAPAHASPAAPGSSLNPQAPNPRVASPAHSPSPIPTPISGGPKPDGLPTRPNLVFGGQGSEAADRPAMPPQSNSHGPQAQHLRRESSQSAHSDQNRGFPPNAGRGRGFQPQPHYNPNVGSHSPQPYRPMPNQPMGRGMPPAFTPQGPMQHNSPYRQNRSPAITPATMHQQQHLANPQGMPYYQGQPYPQPNMYGMPPQGLDPYNNYYGQPAYGLQQSMYAGVPASPSRGHGFPQQMQNPYSMPGPYGQPHQGQSMSRTPSQLSERPPSAAPQPSTPAMTNVNHITHAHTPSVTSASPAPSSSAFERPKKQSKAIIIKNADGEVVDFNKPKGAASPAPNAAPAAPAQPRSPAIVATPTPPPRAPSASDAAKAEEAPAKTASEKKADFVKQFQEKLRLQEEADKKAKDDADSEAKAAAEAEQKKKDDAAAAEAKAAQDAKDKEEAAAKEAAAKEAAAKEAADKEAADKEAAEKEAAEKEAAAKEAAEKEAAEKETAEKEAAAKEAAAKEAKEKEESEAAKAEDDEAEKKRKEDEEFERMVAEMEAEEKKREEEEKRYAEEKKRKKAEEDAKAGDKVKAAEEAMRKAEREAEAAEIARENETPEQKAEREAKDKALFASLKKNTMFGPGATGEEPSEDAAPPAPAPAAKPTSTTKSKPAALKLETNKPVEPAQPTAGMESLKTARFLQIRNEAVNYPEGIQSPNPALNQGSKSKGRQYDKDFLLQFQEVFKEKPSTDWDLKLKETVGDGSDSARTPSVRGNPVGGRAPSGRSGLGGAGGGMGNFGQGGAFGGSRTLPPGTTSQQRFEQASGRGPGTMTNPLAPFVQGGSQRGSFPMGPPGMSRSSSFQPGPNSPRVGSQGGRGDRSRRGGGGQKGHQADTKTMPLTAGKEVKELEKSQTGWKPHGSEKQQVVGHMAPDMVQRKVKAALNKMTPEKFDKISDQILEIAAQSKDETDGRTLRQVIQLTFEKACDESHWSSMYAKFCSRMLQTMSTDIKDENVRDKNGNPVVGGALFRKYLLNRCQEEFERGWEVNLPDVPDANKEATLLSDEYYIAAAAKRKGLGLIQFIGELYKLGMLTLRIMHECVLKLLDFEGLPDESAIESLVKLLRTVGSTMESAEAGPKMINMYFERVEKVMNMEGLPSRLQFMLLDTIDIRKSGWKSKDILKGPKTISEIHQEAVAAQQAAEMERSRSQRGGGGGRLPMGRGDARSFSGGGMMPPQDTGGRVQMDDLRKLSKGASARGLNNPGALGPSMLGSRSGSGRRGLGPGMMGRGGDESGNSSRTGTPPVQKEKSTAHANAFDALAALEAEDNAGEVGSPPPTAAETESKPSE